MINENYLMLEKMVNSIESLIDPTSLRQASYRKALHRARLPRVRRVFKNVLARSKRIFSFTNTKALAKLFNQSRSSVEPKSSTRAKWKF
jgi:hypothetical protein